MNKKKYRFFYHFRRQIQGMTVHFRNQCIPVKNVKCKVPCETKWSNRQPKLVMRGYCSEVIVQNNEAIIQ